MTAPLVVCQMINFQYYFSATDNWAFGSGTKVLHNVVSGVGVMLGRHSDLQTGFPFQALTTGARRFHEPLRLPRDRGGPGKNLPDYLPPCGASELFRQSVALSRLLPSHHGRVFGVSAGRHLEDDFTTDLMMMNAAYILIPALPFAAFLIIALGSRWLGERSHRLAIPAVSASFFLSVLACIDVYQQGARSIPLYTLITQAV